jgi:hypothetical protein
MVDNQHRLIKGYRDLTEDEIAVINRIKEEGERIKELVNNIGDLNVDYAWLHVAELELKSGFMKLTRAVAQPDSF